MINNSDGKLVPQLIKEYFKTEVKPHLTKACIDKSITKTSYEINFTKYFYDLKPLRILAEIKANTMELEEKTVEAEKTILN